MPLAAFGDAIFSRSDFTVNQFTASGPDGRTAIVPFNDLIRIYDSAGDLIVAIDRHNGNENFINNITAFTFLNDGGFVIGGADLGTNLAFQIYNADGTARTAVIQTGRPYAYASAGEILKALPDGGFVFAFDNNTSGTVDVPGGQAGIGHGVGIRTFNAQGVATTPIYDVNANPTQFQGYEYDGRAGEQYLADMDVLANGNVVITYRGDRFPPEGQGQAWPYSLFRVIDPNNGAGQSTSVVGETPYVQTGIGNNVLNPNNQWFSYNTSVLPDGRFVGVFLNSYATNSTYEQELHLQVRNANGSASGATIALGIKPAGFLQNNFVARAQATDAGTILIAFTGYEPGADVSNNANVNIYINEYALDGTQIGSHRVSGAGRDVLGAFERGPDGLYEITWFNQTDARTYTQNFVYTTSGELAQVYGDSANVITRGLAHDIVDAAGGADFVNGGAGNDTLMGGAGDDTLDGGASGTDKLMGGLGNDTYVNTAGDQIVEYALSGIDTVESAVTFSLQSLPNVENVTLTGSVAANATGNAAGNYLLGNTAVNTLIGAAGADTLEGGGAADSLEGGTGNDWYINPTGDTIVELAGQGFDRVISDGSFSLATLGNIERLDLTGAVPGFLRGNQFANQLVGNSGSNRMEGLDGNDQLYGEGGRDTLIGGLGRDQLNPGIERDTLQFNSVAESTGALRDFVSEFVFSQGSAAYESLDFHIVPTALRTTITTGTLREGFFDTDLQTAVDATNLGVGQAVLFDPNGGDLNVAGHLYLIVDANNQAGYQAGADYVLQFTSSYGTLTLANFI